MSSEGKTPPNAPNAPNVPNVTARLDAALRDWPTAEKSALDWDDAAERVMARIDAGESGASTASVSDEYLLAPPLAQTTEEIQNSAALGKGEASRRASRPSFTDAGSASGSEAGKMGQSSSEQRASRRQSLKELAELARNSSPPPSAGTGSGVHRAGESQATLGSLGSAGLFDDDVQASGPASLPPSVDPLRPSMPPVAPSVAPPASEPVAATPSYAPALIATRDAKAARSNDGNKRGGMLYGVIAFGAVAAAAAGVFFVMKTRNVENVAASPQGTAIQQTTGGNKPVQAAPEVQLQEGDPNAPTTALAPTATATGTMPLLPLAPTQLAQQQPLLPLAPNAPAKPEAPAAAPTDTAPAPAASAAPAPAGDPKSLQDQMRQAAGQAAPSAPPPQNDNPGAPAPSPTNIPMRPSQGAASGAVGAVLYSARACLGPDDPVSQATIVFQSSGAVQSVSVTGGAAGKPQEACIKQALSRAKVAPFAQSSFAFSVTLRPN